MRLAVLSAPDSWYVRDLTRAAGELHSIHALPFSRIQSSIHGGVTISTVDQALEEFDAVLVRTMPPGSLEQVVFRMDALQQLEASGQRVLNPPKAIEAAVDKYLTLAKLQADGFNVPRTETCQTAEDAMQSFADLGGDVVVKPLFGSEGRGITRIHDEAIAERTFRLLVQLGAIVYLQEYVEHEGYDMRLLVLGNEVFGMRRRNPLDWRTNVSRGAISERMEVTDALADLARKATACVGAVMAGVDVLPAKDGRQLLVEVNAVPGWRALARTLDLDVAAKVLRICSSGS